MSTSNPDLRLAVAAGANAAHSGPEEYDFVIVGSGFGGSVSALRLAEKGYRVLVLEKGRRFAAEDFPTSNWDLKRWMWRPQFGLRGSFAMSFLNHVTVLHGVGVGGGSLVYANTMPEPPAPFFIAKSWSHLADFKTELEPHYATAKRMLGATQNPYLTTGDRLLAKLAKDRGRSDHFSPADVAVYFGKPGETVADPYFGGEGPPRTGCEFCGGCMTGCRVGAKNTLDKNYLYLAEKRGVGVRAETEVTAVRERLPGDASKGYVVETRHGRARQLIYAARVVFAGGVMGTVPLLLAMREDRDGLPRLSAQVGRGVRTNSEALIGVVSPHAEYDFSRGVAITSIFHTDDHSHVEPVRYGAGSGFFRTMILPHEPGPNVLYRLAGAARSFLRHPRRWLRALTVRDFAKSSQILLYMRALEGSLTLSLGRSVFNGFQRGLVTRLDPGTPPPRAFMAEATELARHFAQECGGVSVAMLSETLLGTPTTAHILGGACMGKSKAEGVIDAYHGVHDYPGLYVIDGSAVSANPGVNPSLTISALAERAMAAIPPR